MDIEQIRNTRIADYNYPLPDERIAKHPLAQREQCKLLHWHNGIIDDKHFYDLPSLLPDGTMLIYNNTRVINARLRFKKDTGSTIEIFCLEPVLPRDYALVFQTTHSCTWQCLVGNSKRWKQGVLTQKIAIDGKAITVTATRGEAHGGSWHITFDWDGEDITFATLLEHMGEIPIPPYLNRGTESSDSTDYQTVYSHIDGSVAAPTAGLHFTDEVLAECDARGIVRRELTLHVGAGTFQPVKSEQIGNHDMHYEWVQVARDLIAELATTTRPVYAVGTTSVRTLESLYFMGQILHDNPTATDLTVRQWMPYTTPCAITRGEALEALVNHLDHNDLKSLVASTQLMIAPGYKYQLVDGMITNFHQPQSTLLLLVAAFTGQDRWRHIYDHALSGDYRFLSYGDACLLQH